MERMTAKPKPNKRDAILNAMLDVVAERGFHEAPMSLIAERSGASAGVIYHHFASKEAIIQALYERVSELKRTKLLAGYSPDMDAKEAFILAWTNWYNFYRKHPREMRFLHQYETAGFVCRPEKAPYHDQQAIEFQRRFRSQSTGGVLNDLPAEVIQELTFGVVERLARQPRKLAPGTLRTVAEKMWEAVKAED
jgi:TetR/AcrR family transcriptional regulator, repressor of fatR-cypB operon